MSTFADRQKTATADEATVRICLDRALYRRYVDAYNQLDQLELARKAEDGGDEQTTLDGPSVRGRLQAKAREVADLGEQMRDAEEPYLFRKIQQTAWRALGGEHPPTDEQREDGADVDPDTFWPAAVSRCAVDPELTEGDVCWLRDGDGEWPGLPPAKFDEIVNSVKKLHTTGLDVPKGSLSIAQMLAQGTSGTTPARGASRSRSSAAASRGKTSRTG